MSVKDEGPKQSAIVRLVTESIVHTLPETNSSHLNINGGTRLPRIFGAVGGAWVGVIFHDFLFT